MGTDHLTCTVKLSLMLLSANTGSGRTWQTHIPLPSPDGCRRDGSTATENNSSAVSLAVDEYNHI